MSGTMLAAVVEHFGKPLTRESRAVDEERRHQQTCKKRMGTLRKNVLGVLRLQPPQGNQEKHAEPRLLSCPTVRAKRFHRPSNNLS